VQLNDSDTFVSCNNCCMYQFGGDSVVYIFFITKSYKVRIIVIVANLFYVYFGKNSYVMLYIVILS